MQGVIVSRFPLTTQRSFCGMSRLRLLERRIVNAPILFLFELVHVLPKRAQSAVQRLVVILLLASSASSDLVHLR